jgi:tetratricopeptide (TPR) repeat protein
MKRNFSLGCALALLALFLPGPAIHAQQGSLLSPGTPLQTENGTPPSERPSLTIEQRADLFMARKEYADAADSYGQALRRSGITPDETASLWNRLGIAFQAELKYGPARKAYKNALRFRKDFAEPWNNLGTTYFMQKKYGKSQKYYLHAIELNSQSATMHMNLGTTYYHLNHFDKAVGEYRTALVLDPDVLRTPSTLGTTVETRESDPKFYYYLAKSFANLGRVEEAVRYLRRAFEDGFSDFKGLNDDPDFKKISQAPAYVELIKSPPVAIKD